MLFITEDQVRSSANIDDVIRAIGYAFARDFRTTLQMPLRTRLDIGPSILLLMPCYDSELNAAGIKTVTIYPEYGVKAIYTLINPASGGILAVIEANYLTEVRTAVTSAVATDLLARHNVETLGVFGAGRQAKIHFAVLPHVRNFKRFLVCGSQYSNLTAFCKSVREEHGIQVEPVNAETCARESDVLCTCTTSHEPLFDGRVLRPGTHLNLVGAFQTHTREVDDETVRRARVIVDTYEGALAEAGDLIIPMRDKKITSNHILADLHELASSRKQGRTSPEDITLFKSVGCALEDLVTAKLVYARLNSAEQ